MQTSSCGGGKMASMRVSPRKRSPSPCRSMSVSPPPPDSIPSLSLDEIIASNRRTAAAARRTHYANHHNTPRSRKSPYLRHTPASLPPRGTPAHHGNRRRHHPYSKPKTPAQKRESPAMHAGGGKRLLVSNLAPQVTDEDLQKFLSKAGKLIDCSVHYDANGDSKGSALIEFAKEKGAINALINLQGAVLRGMPIVLDTLLQ